MLSPDLINALFEFGAGLMSIINIRRIYKDKDVKGYSPWVFGFFSAWGMWNLFYYPYLDQWLSFFGGLSIMLANITWLALAVKYLYIDKRKISPDPFPLCYQECYKHRDCDNCPYTLHDCHILYGPCRECPLFLKGCPGCRPSE